jgi:hypothetical protein
MPTCAINFSWREFSQDLRINRLHHEEEEGQALPTLALVHFPQVQKEMTLGQLMMSQTVLRQTLHFHQVSSIVPIRCCEHQTCFI